MTLAQRIEAATDHLAKLPLADLFGRVTDIKPYALRGVLPNVRLGAVCSIERSDMAALMAEVTAIAGTIVTLSPFSDPSGIEPGARIVVDNPEMKIPVSASLLGAVVDPFMRPLGAPDDPADPVEYRSVRKEPSGSMGRPIISATFETGIRAIDGLATLGRGQRIGVFGPPGTGKTSLMGMLAGHCAADVVVIALVGERGREVRELVEDVLPKETRSHVVVVAATSDRPPIERALCAYSATTVAEYFRDQGKDVFLLVDSLTRTARALREIGLAAGEAPVRRGYPASVYPALPALIERAGRSRTGTITALYNVLTEGQIESDPIAEEVKSLTDGHLVLDRELAEKGHFPALNMLQSLSRTMTRLVEPAHNTAASTVRRHLAKYADIELLLQMGEYNSGGDTEADEAIAAIPAIKEFLRQSADDATGFSQTRNQLQALAT